MLTTSAYGLAILLDVFIIIIGVRFLLVPHVVGPGRSLRPLRSGITDSLRFGTISDIGVTPCLRGGRYCAGAGADF